MPSRSLAGRVVVVTGASRGIGRAIAWAAARAGADLALLARGAEGLEETARGVREAGTRALAAPCDVADEASVKAAARAVHGTYPRVDVLVNNAGVFVSKPFLETSVEDWDRTLDVNLRGVFLCSRAFLPGMVARRSGKVINVSSIHGRLGDERVTAQCASKFGVVGLTEALAREMREHGISVNAICPGTVDATGEAPPERSPLVRRLVPDEVARLAIFLASDDADGITGSSLDVFGGTEVRIQVRR